MTQYTKVFEPGKIGKLQLKNRIIFAPVLTLYATQDGEITQKLIDYYAERARGGCGLVVVEASYPYIYPGRISIHEDRFITGLRRLATAIHDGGAKAAIEINPGRGRSDDVDPTSASDTIHPRTGAKVRGLSIAEIKEAEYKLGEGARRVKEAGFDSVMIHGCSGYIVAEFLSPKANRRTDEYGGDIKNRARFALELVAAVREKTGADYPVTFRLVADERLEGGFRIEEGIAVAQLLEEAGIDAIDVVSGGVESFPWVCPYMYMPLATNVDLSRAIKKAVKIPISTAGRINNPDLAEEILRRGEADFVSLGRALVAGPQFPNKAKEGRADDIRKCIACCRCEESILKKPVRPMVCSVNPTVGKEKETELGLKLASKRKNVLVIGGGPAGMEAAIVAAQRGHNVTLWEKDHSLGGQLKIASVPPGKAEMQGFADYLIRQLDKLKVAVKLGREATAAAITEFSPDVVILAVGPKPKVPKIKGMGKKKCVFFDDVLSGKVDIGESVVVSGGSFVGCETADFLSEKGKRVTLISGLPTLAPEMYYPYADLLIGKLEENGVKAFTGIQEREITEKGMAIIDREGKRISLEADDVVIAAGSVPDKSLLEAIRGKVAEVYEVGDCVEARRLQEAVVEGAEVGLEI